MLGLPGGASLHTDVSEGFVQNQALLRPHDG